MAYAALLVSGLALVFTIGSFWWLHARTGSLEAASPRAYGFVSMVDDSAPEPVPSTIRLRLPLAFFNTGAKAQIVNDLRLVVDDAGVEPLPWIITRRTMRADRDDHAFATPFAVPGRSTNEVIAEFGHDRGWRPEPHAHHRICLQARVHPSESWKDILAFDWWAPPSAETMGSNIVYANVPGRQPSVGRRPSDPA